MRKTFAVTALTALSLAVAAPVAIGSAQAQTQLIQTQPKPVAERFTFRLLFPVQ